MNRRGAILLTGHILAGALMHAMPIHAETVAIRVAPNTTHQVMDGFGASGAWWAQHVGGWPEGKVDRIVDLLYGSTGAAMTIYRYNVGAGGGDEIHDPWRRAKSFETEAGRYDWSRDAHAASVLRKVRARGVDQFVFFANSPPLRLTATGMASGGPEGGSNLKQGAEAEFARYLTDIVEHWRKALGLTDATVSPVNEPQWRWGGDGRGQEGCHYSAAEAAAVLQATAEVIKERDLPLLLEGPEAARWGHETPRYLDAVLDHEALAGRLHRLAIHSYFSSTGDKAATMAHLADREGHPAIAMTEWCEMRHGRDVTMESALTMARVMHEDLTLGNVVSWQAWIAVSRYDYKDGLLYVDPKTREITPAKRLWVMGQYARFVRKDFTRVEAGADDAKLLVTAFVSPAKDEIVVVAVNPERDPRQITLRWDTPGRTPRLKDVHVTSPTKDLAPVAQAGGGPLRLEPESVTTIRLTR